MRETYAYTILGRKTKKLRKETDNPHLRSVLDKGHSSTSMLATAIVRPSKMLICSPVILLLSLLMFIVYGYLYLMFTALPALFHGTYGFSTGSIGLTYLGLGIGSFAGSVFSGVTSDRLANYMQRKTVDGEPKPEYRLPLVAFASFVVPVGLFWIGWTAESHQHWVLPIIGTSILSFGVTVAFVSRERRQMSADLLRRVNRS